MAYRSALRDSLRIVVLDSLTAIYNRASGQTHIVAEPVPELLAALAGEALTMAELIDRLKLEHDDATRALLTERIDELRQAGLVVEQ